MVNYFIYWNSNLGLEKCKSANERLCRGPMERDFKQQSAPMALRNDRGLENDALCETSQFEKYFTNGFPSKSAS